MKNRKRYVKNLKRFGQKGHRDPNKLQRPRADRATDHATGYKFKADKSTTRSVLKKMAALGVVK